MLEIQLFAQVGATTPQVAGLPEWLKIFLASVGAGVITGFITILANSLRMRHELNTEYGKLHAVKKLEAYQAFCRSLVVLPDASKYARDPSSAPSPKVKAEEIFAGYYFAYPFLDKGARNAFDSNITNLLVKPGLEYDHLIVATTEVLKAATDDLDTMKE